MWVVLWVAGLQSVLSRLPSSFPILFLPFSVSFSCLFLFFSLFSRPLSLDLHVHVFGSCCWLSCRMVVVMVVLVVVCVGCVPFISSHTNLCSLFELLTALCTQQLLVIIMMSRVLMMTVGYNRSHSQSCT